MKENIIQQKSFAFAVRAIKAYKFLTQEKKDVIKLCDEKDSKIKQILIKLEQSNLDTHAMGKKIHALEETDLL